jgi:hypothetical protein
VKEVFSALLCLLPDRWEKTIDVGVKDKGTPVPPFVADELVVIMERSSLQLAQFHLVEYELKDPGAISVYLA